MIVIKLILISCIGLISYQDIKDRQVYWFLYPILGISSAILFYNSTLPELFFVSIGMNLLFVLTLIIILIVYAKMKLKMKINEAIGLGDILLFFGLVFSFSTLSFLVLFVFSLLFSLILHLIVKKYSKWPSVPLAGYISLFYGIAYALHWSGFTNSLYAY
ncbi:hypothetical protein [Winogradskyella tangerina]|uniref:hypothetical protein n=1 Tax=Winogradskyella tangerina TaxID=2023240 RepID=UPI000DBE162E|nr:hypothetical protein [Winogradskyella tangerina]